MRNRCWDAEFPSLSWLAKTDDEALFRPDPGTGSDVTRPLTGTTQPLISAHSGTGSDARRPAEFSRRARPVYLARVDLARE
jgi:hypothetical protein